MLDETMSGETMALSVINKINNKLKFLYRKNRFLTPTLRRLLCNALIQPHFDYACSAWYPSLTKKLKNRIQTSQNKCIRFCLQSDKMTHISHNIYKRCIIYIYISMYKLNCFEDTPDTLKRTKNLNTFKHV